MKFWVGLGSRSIQELRVGSGFSLGLKVWVGLGHKLGKILGLLWVKALVTLRFSGWVGSGFFGFFANSSPNPLPDQKFLHPHGFVKGIDAISKKIDGASAPCAPL